MRSIRVLLVMMLLNLLPFAANASDGKLTVHVVGLKNNNGVVRIALFNSADAYAKAKFTGESAYRTAAIPIAAKEATCSFENIPNGEYAIKLFHDEDNSNKFKANMFGIPKVDYGFSNNPRAAFGPANYSQAHFSLNTNSMTLEIKMQHAL